MVGEHTKIDERYRSLLQKAVRRGNEALVYTVSALLGALGPAVKSWYRLQVPIIVFEECWPLGAGLALNKKFHSKVAALIKAARCRKCRDALGLGYLAHALYSGHQSVLDGSPDDRDIKIVARAVHTPDDFWQWIDSQKLPPAQQSLAETARQFRRAGYLHDKAVIQSAAYLATEQPVPAINTVPPVDETFPYWVVFDHHTRRGNRVLRDIARDLHIPLRQLEWSSYYSETARVNDEMPSKWWEKYCCWQFEKRINLPREQVSLVWEPAKPQVVAELAEDARKLQRELYRWKMDHLEAVSGLKRQVELFIEHFEGVRPDQLDLF
jgi:hypothetical protein